VETLLKMAMAAIYQQGLGPISKTMAAIIQKGMVPIFKDTEPRIPAGDPSGERYVQLSPQNPQNHSPQGKQATAKTGGIKPLRTIQPWWLIWGTKREKEDTRKVLERRSMETKKARWP
jgi:hypothetical protein